MTIIKNNSKNSAYSNYSPNASVRKAQDLLNQHLGTKPGAYQSQWQGQLDDQVNSILNREKFDYDLNADALFQQYKDNYTRQGQLAMMDTMGQAAALTGGYGNSYAQNVGQQAYQGYLQQLNDKVPEFYQMAQNQYNLEGQQMLDNAALLAQQEARERELYESAYSKWLSERDYLSGRYDSERNYDYGMFTDNRDFAYQQERDRVADEQWQKQYNLSKRSSSSGGSNTKKKDDPQGDVTPTLAQIETDLMSMGDGRQMLNFMRECRAKGYITDAQYKNLQRKYFRQIG